MQTTDIFAAQWNNMINMVGLIRSAFILAFNVYVSDFAKLFF